MPCRGRLSVRWDRQGASQAFQWFFPSDDYYYTFIDHNVSATEPTCCPDGIANLIAHWVLFWPVQCNINVKRGW